MLHFITGGSGSGKSEYIQRLLCKLCAEGEDKLMVLVPDQSSFDTEKSFLQKLGAKDSRKIKVFGFSRLCDFVVAQSVKQLLPVLEEPDRALIMSLALDAVADSLTLFSRKSSAENFISPLLDAIGEYEKCAVSPDELRQAAAKTRDTALKNKLTDTALVYDAYNSILENRYTEPLKRLEIVKNCLLQENPFSGYIIAVDSFANFTAVEKDILSILMRDSREMYIALTLERYTEDRSGVFFTTNRTYHALSRIAKNNGIKISPDIVLNENCRTSNKNLAALEKNIFRSEYEAFPQESCGLMLYRAATIYEECEFVASEIKRLIVSEGYVFDDFAVLMRSFDDYGITLQSALEKYNLRYFNDRREPVSDKPLIKLIFYIFDIVTGGFDPESVLQLLKTGLLPASDEEIAEFENYLYCWSITSQDIRKPFMQNPRGFAPKLTADDSERLQRIERIRKLAVDNLSEFRAACADSDAQEITKALYKLLLDLNVDKCLLELSEDYRRRGNRKFADEQLRLWDCLMHGFDKIVMIVGDRRMKLQRYSNLLQLQLARADMGFIPQGQDLITIGSIDRIKPTGKRAVFVLGAIDGKFPRTPEASGIFSDSERRQLLNIGLNLDYSCEDLIKQEKFLAYTALTCPSDKLYISYYTQNLTGEVFTPSCIISEVCKIFPDVAINTLPLSLDTERRLYSEKAAFDFCAERFKNSDALSVQLKDYFSEKEIYSHKIAAMERALKKRRTDLSGKDRVKQLFGEELNVSASQIEKYYGCRFSYLCSYGFKIRERRKFTIDALEYGSFMHYILQRFFSENAKESFVNLSAEAVSEKVSGYIRDYEKEALGTTGNENERFAYLLHRIEAAAERLIIHMAQELAQSNFRPEFFEYRIGRGLPVEYGVTLDSGEDISISGSIDRVDIMRDENDIAKYVRIIDYKTGKKKFNLYDILYGLNLQMLLYLSAVCKDNSLLPAGILYMPAVDPIINADNSDDFEKIRKKLDKEYTMNGLLLDRTEALVAMEKKLEGKYIPVSTRNREKNSSLVTEEQFRRIFAFLDEKITAMGEGIYSGNFSPLPTKGSSDACTWCPYGDICGFADGDVQNNIYACENSEVFKIIEESEAEQNGTKLD